MIKVIEDTAMIKNFLCTVDFICSMAMNLLALRFRMRSSRITRRSIGFCFVVLLFPSTQLIAQSSVVTLESQVKGNQEQPNILSIVPWKQADDFGRIDEAIELSVNDVFQHLDRDEFAREYDFYQHHLTLEEQESKQAGSE